MIKKIFYSKNSNWSTCIDMKSISVMLSCAIPEHHIVPSSCVCVCVNMRKKNILNNNTSPHIPVRCLACWAGEWYEMLNNIFNYFTQKRRAIFFLHSYVCETFIALQMIVNNFLKSCCFFSIGTPSNLHTTHTRWLYMWKLLQNVKFNNNTFYLNLRDGTFKNSSKNCYNINTFIYFLYK